MANFEIAFNLTMENEGGYKVHKNQGEETITYAGIYRKAHPTWEGWQYLDRGETPPTEFVRSFYRINFWQKIKGDEIQVQEVANNMYDFLVNAGTNSIKVTQKVLNVASDGVFGAKTLKALNDKGKDFIMPFVLCRCSYYAQLITKKPKYAVFANGWIDRAIRGSIS